MKICRECNQNLPHNAFHHGAVCRPCLNKIAKGRMLERFTDGVQVVDVVVPCSTTIPQTNAYHLLGALSNIQPAIHGNAAIGVILEEGSIRFRLFQGRKPSWLTSPSSRWEPAKIVDLAILANKKMTVAGIGYQLGLPHVERLKPCRVLRVLSVERHPHRGTRQCETIRRRLLGAGVLCRVVPSGTSFALRTGKQNFREGTCTATPMLVYCDRPRDGLVAQMMPIGTSGRYGGGICLAEPGDHDIEIRKDGLRTLKSVEEELGVDHTTIQYWMRKLGYDKVSPGHGRWFDDAIVSRLRSTIPSIGWRKQNGRCRQRWTQHELDMLFSWMVLGRPWNDLEGRIGRSAKTCAIKACRFRKVMQEAGTMIGVLHEFDQASQLPAKPKRVWVAA